MYGINLIFHYVVSTLCINYCLSANRTQIAGCSIYLDRGWNISMERVQMGCTSMNILVPVNNLYMQILMCTRVYLSPLLILQFENATDLLR